jgi:hypothetical protein
MYAPEDELFVESRVHKGDGDAVVYEKVNEHVRLDAGDVGEDDGRGETQIPSRASLA